MFIKWMNYMNLNRQMVTKWMYYININGRMISKWKNYVNIMKEWLVYGSIILI